MTDFPEQGSASIEIDAARDGVWALVADITRMGEYSPECVHAAWENGATMNATLAAIKAAVEA